MVGLHGPRHRMGLVSRIDIPPPAQCRDVVAKQLRAMRREGDDQFVALVVSDVRAHRAPRGQLPMPHRGLARELRRQARAQGQQAMDVVAVGGSRWRSYGCDDVTCCPAEGHSLESALSGPAAAWLVAEGHVLAESEAELLADVDPDRGPGVAWPEPPGEPTPNLTTVDGALRLGPADAREALARWRRLLAGPAGTAPGDLAWIADVLEDRWLRDAVLLTLIPGSGTVPDELLTGGDPPAMDTVFGNDPDDDLLERGRLLLSAVARSAPAGRRADALALLAWAAWYAGHGLRARLLAHRALADRPAHRLARLVDELLVAEVPPAWVERRRPVPVRPAAGGADG